MFIIRI